MALFQYLSNLRGQEFCPPLEVKGLTVREVLNAAFLANPRLEAYVLDENRAVRKHMKILVDGQAIKNMENLDVAVNPTSLVLVIAFELSGIGRICADLLPKLLSGVACVVDRNANPIVVIKANHAEVGDITVDDDGHELTVYFGDNTHLHFEAWYEDDHDPEFDGEFDPEHNKWRVELVSDNILGAISEKRARFRTAFGGGS
jgi:sulfur-carrier protein